MKPKKQSYHGHKYLYNKRIFFHFFCTAFVIHFNPFLIEKKFLSSGNKVFWVDVNFVNEMHFN